MKAYTQEDRALIRKRLLEAGLTLFHDQGVRSISIRELTKRAGIAQGGFYSFFPDKEALVIELIHYRSFQKMELFEKTFEQSLGNPAAFVSEALFRMSWDLKLKGDQKQMYRDILHLCLQEKTSQQEKLFEVLYASLEKLGDYWEAQGLSVAMDVRGIRNVIKGSMILYASLDRLEVKYAKPIIKTFFEENCKQYIRCCDNRKEGPANDPLF